MRKKYRLLDKYYKMTVWLSIFIILVCLEFLIRVEFSWFPIIGITLQVINLILITIVANREYKNISCYSCANMMSHTPDVVCHLWCSETDRDWTFGYERDDICSKYEED